MTSRHLWYLTLTMALAGSSCLSTSATEVALEQGGDDDAGNADGGNDVTEDSPEDQGAADSGQGDTATMDSEQDVTEDPDAPPPSCDTNSSWYPDLDGDGFGDDDGAPTTECPDDFDGWAARAGDCNDTDPDVNPGETELPGDGTDSNCDGRELCFVDLDGDGFHQGQTVESANLHCDGEGETDDELGGGDCDESSRFVHPGAIELCDNQDNDCDSEVDEGTAPQTWYADDDSDGYGDPTDTVESCELVDGYELRAGDCDDNAPEINPGAQEVCDGVDNNCGGVDVDAVDMLEFYVDADGDGHGDETQPSVWACSQPDGTTTEVGDCDDSDPESWLLQRVYPDDDGDGYTAAAEQRCLPSPLGPDVLTEPRRPPYVSFDPRFYRGPMWDRGGLDDLFFEDGSALECIRDCDFEPLVVGDFGLRLPAGTAITGVEFVVRRETEKITDDSSVTLVPASLGSESRAGSNSWARIWEVATYGGPTDLWGIGITPADVADPSFGISISTVSDTSRPKLRVDYVALRVYATDTVDCDDNDPSVWSPAPGYVDADGDGAGSTETFTYCVGSTRPQGYTAHDDDCYDDNVLANPYATARQTVDRGDGSFDYDCDGVLDAAALSSYSGCTLNSTATGCTWTTNTLVNLECGTDHNLGRCSFNSTVPACSSTSVTATVACR